MSTATAEVLEPRNPVAVQPPASPTAILADLIKGGATLDVIREMKATQEWWEGREARKQFDRAIAAAKAAIPVIIKSATGHNAKKYANFADIARVVDPILGDHGLSYRFRTVQDEKLIRVTCVLSHEAGHSEETTLAGPADTTGSKNAIQSIGSTLTYLQRYSLVQALGLAAAEDDDGKAGSAGGVVNEEQIGALRSLIVEVAADIPKFCKYMKVTKIEEIPAARYADAVKALEAKRSAS